MPAGSEPFKIHGVESGDRTCSPHKQNTPINQLMGYSLPVPAGTGSAPVRRPAGMPSGLCEYLYLRRRWILRSRSNRIKFASCNGGWRLSTFHFLSPLNQKRLRRKPEPFFLRRDQRPAVLTDHNTGRTRRDEAAAASGSLRYQTCTGSTSPARLP